MSDDRPPIPLALKRAVRQRCKFGCVVCGCPVFEYDHIIDWSQVKEHDEANLTLLCLPHHGEKTSGLLPLPSVVTANGDPYNGRTGQSPPHPLHFGGTRGEITLGGNTFGADLGTDFYAVVIDSIPLVHFRYLDGQLMLNARLLNLHGDVVLLIRDNELILNASSWDIDWVGRTLTIRAGAGNIILELRFDPPSKVSLLRGHFVANGVEIYIQGSFLVLLNEGLAFSDCGTEGRIVGMRIGDDLLGRPAGFVVPGLRDPSMRAESVAYLRSSLGPTFRAPPPPSSIL